MAGYLAQQEALKNIDYYWKIESGTKYYCNMHYDPFFMMKGLGKKYSYNYIHQDSTYATSTLWASAKRYIKDKLGDKVPKHMTPFLDQNKEYSGRHFWSTFEITSLDFLRSDAYTSFFEHLDKSGGFFYERWTEGPVHTLAVALLLNPGEVHLFNDVGFLKAPFFSCPAETRGVDRLMGVCNCDSDIPMKNMTHIGKDVIDDKYYPFVQRLLKIDKRGSRLAYWDEFEAWDNKLTELNSKL
ncbi:alpha 1,2-mannosyltransferase 2.4.1 [Chytridiales sp. JEL 0842]|nr:alpha 1,2-mannosyltransferase 2.4.1 [Chytridiales sp. JEL 0842]